MPELPEVETVKRALAQSSLNQHIKDIIQYRPNIRYEMPKAMGQKFKDKAINNYQRIGKYIVMDIDHADSIIIHLGMSGHFRIEKTLLHPLPKHCHVVFICDDVVLHYIDPRRFGMIDIIADGDITQSKYLCYMGVDPFSNHLNSDYLYQQLQKKRVSIKQALLDQRIIAGIGNIYACEILWHSAISPLRLCHDVRHDECDKIVAHTRMVLQQAIDSGGSTLRDFAHGDGSLGYFQHYFHCYDRLNEQCQYKNCNGYIKSLRQSGRSSYYCNIHQK